MPFDAQAMEKSHFEDASVVQKLMKDPLVKHPLRWMKKQINYEMNHMKREVDITMRQYFISISFISATRVKTIQHGFL